MARVYKLLEVENLNTSFKIDAGKVLSVNGVSFTLEKGKILGIVGESGSGKSVTAYSIMQILDKNGKIDSGKIIYNGTDLVKLSEKEMREIRGNKISIIFQDAMTSLNPTWTIGNQLREAILTHAKDPVKEALSNIENDIKSDEQRIAAMEKGLLHHPDNQQLKEDLETIRKKNIQDKELYQTRKLEIKKNYNELKKQKNQEYAQGKKAYDKKIKEASLNHFKNYFKLAPYPNESEFSSTKGAKVLQDAIRLKQEFYNEQKTKMDNLEKTFLSEHPTVAKEDQKTVLAQEKKNEKLILGAAKKELASAEKAYRKFIREKRREAHLAPRRERRKLLLQAIKEKNDFHNECVSAYKETKYSANKKALQMLIEVGITEPEKRMKQYPFELSGGMLQRCMIAMALVGKPDILIADEPTTALDVTIQAQILDLLKKLQKEYGMAIIIITHDLGVVAQMCDEVNIMYAGRIVERGSTDEIFYNPQHEYTKGLINSMPKIDSGGKRLEPIQGNPVDLFCLPKGCAFSSRCKECMQICIDSYPEEVKCNESGHAASCWKMIKRLHDEGLIDVVNAKPEGKPLIYNGAIIANNKKSRKEK